MKLLAVSDLHRNLDAAHSIVERSGDADVVVVAGDFAVVHRGLDEVIDVLREIERPTVVVPGNNETLDALQAACSGWDAAVVLHGNGTELDGVPFYGLGAGVPITPWDWSFDLSDEAATDMLSGCPDEAVLVSHSPPKNHVDSSSDGTHLGSEAVLEAVKTKHPRLVVCGHIHESWGQDATEGETLIRNLGPDGVMLEV